MLHVITLTVKFALADLHIKEKWTTGLGGGLHSLSNLLVMLSVLFQVPGSVLSFLSIWMSVVLSRY